MAGTPWSTREDVVLRALYERQPMSVLRDRLPGRSAKAIYHRAQILGVNRSGEYLSKYVGRVKVKG